MKKDKTTFKIYPVERFVIEETHEVINEETGEIVKQCYIYCECESKEAADSAVIKRKKDLERLFNNG